MFPLLLALALPARAEVPVDVWLQPRAQLEIVDGEPAPADSGFTVRRLLIMKRGVTGVATWRFRIDVARAATILDAEGKDRLVARALLDDCQVGLPLTGPLSLYLGRSKIPFSEGFTLGSTTTSALPEHPLAYGGDKRLGVTGLEHGRDTGAMLQLQLQRGVFTGQGGAVMGDGGLTLPHERAMAGFIRASANQEGMPRAELDLDRGPWRIGGGAPALLDGEGSWSATAGIRSAGRGMFLAAEAGGASDGRLGGYAMATWAPPPLPLAPAARFSLLDDAWAMDLGFHWLMPGDDVPRADRTVLLWGQAGAAGAEPPVFRVGHEAAPVAPPAQPPPPDQIAARQIIHPQTRPDRRPSDPAPLPPTSAGAS